MMYMKYKNHWNQQRCPLQSSIYVGFLQSFCEFLLVKAVFAGILLFIFVSMLRKISL